MIISLASCIFAFSIYVQYLPDTAEIPTEIVNVNYSASNCPMDSSGNDVYLIYNNTLPLTSFNHPLEDYEIHYHCQLFYTEGNATYHIDLVDYYMSFEGDTVTLYNHIDNDTEGLVPFITRQWFKSGPSFLNIDYTFIDTNVLTSTQGNEVYDYPYDTHSHNLSYYSGTLNYKLMLNYVYGAEDFEIRQDNEYVDGFNAGEQYGFQNGKVEGYNEGYLKGKEDFEDQDSVINSIFSGILSVGLIPVEFLMSIFNFEILGINITQIVSAILTLMVIVILMRIILGGKSGSKGD